MLSFVEQSTIVEVSIFTSELVGYPQSLYCGLYYASV